MASSSHTRIRKVFVSTWRFERGVEPQNRKKGANQRKKLKTRKFFSLFSAPQSSFFFDDSFSLLSKRKIRKVFIVQHQQCYISSRWNKIISTHRKTKKGASETRRTRFLARSSWLQSSLSGFCVSCEHNHTHSFSLYHRQIVLNVLLVRPCRSILPFFPPCRRLMQPRTIKCNGAIFKSAINFMAAKRRREETCSASGLERERAQLSRWNLSSSLFSSASLNNWMCEAIDTAVVTTNLTIFPFPNMMWSKPFRNALYVSLASLSRATVPAHDTWWEREGRRQKKEPKS